MGEALSIHVYQFREAPAFRQAVGRVATELGFSIAWDTTAENQLDLRTATTATTSILYLDPAFPKPECFIRKLGITLDCALLELRLQEGAIWDYSLYSSGQWLDTFSVCVEYWQDEELTEQANKLSDKEHLDLLVKIWKLDRNQVARYIRNWGYNEVDGTIEFSLRGKAYPTDESEYGVSAQMWDFARAIGAEWPQEIHSLLHAKPATDE